jgi:hypothetical protein
MIELSTLQAVREIITILGIIGGLSYYIVTVRNQHKSRQAQLFNQLYEGYTSPEANKTHIEMLAMEWGDYHEFEMKYGSDYNIDSAARRLGHMQWLNGVGLLLKEGLINIDLVYPTIGSGAIAVWTKFESVIREQRVRYNMLEYCVWLEYLVEEIKKVRRSRGLPTEPKEYYVSYIPDQ